MNERSSKENPTLRELKKISKILVLANASVIEKELSKVAASDARKKMWVFLDGKRMPKDIAKEAGVTPMAASYFLSAGAAAKLIEYKRGEPPRRILDYVPPSWIDLAKLPMVEEKKAEAAQKQNQEMLTKKESEEKTDE